MTSADIASSQQVETSRIAGTYQLLIHKYGLDHRKKELVTPVEITLHADGTISGAKTGKWRLVDGTSYVTMTIVGVQYKGVIVEQTMEPSQTKRVPAFTAMAKSGVTVWGYRSGDDMTAIHDVDGQIVKSKSSDGKFIDLSGRRITAPRHKSVYIRNGRKIYYK